jgi:tetratricopeptide (TPR) repeat protein
MVVFNTWSKNSNVCTAVALLAVSAAAMSGAETLQCTIVSLKGEPLKDVEVRLTGSTDRNDQYAKTRGDGRVNFANLSAGDYALAAQRKGYMPLHLKITVPSDQPLRRTLLSEKEFASVEKKANDALNAGDFVAAVQHMTELAGYYPRDAVMHENLARAYAGLQEEQKALAEAALASELDAGRAPVANEVQGVLLRGAGEKALKARDFKTAVAKFDALRELNPQSADAYHGLALAYGHMGRFKEALQAIDEAIKLRPNDANLPAIKQALEANAGIR